MITIKLANGKEVSSESGEEIFWFHQSEGRSIVKPLLKPTGDFADKQTEKQSK